MLCRLLVAVLALCSLYQSKAWSAVTGGGSGFFEAGDVHIDSDNHPLTDDEANVTGSSRLDLEGTGLLNQVVLSDFATFEITGGAIRDDDDGAVVLSGNTHATIRDGIIYSEESSIVDAAGNSTVQILGGIFTTERSSEFAIRASEQSVIDVYGGDFTVGPSVDLFTAVDLGQISIYGFGLQIVDGVLTGQLANGGSLSHSVSVDGSGAIHLHNIPEPSTGLLFAAAFWGWPLLRRRR